MYCEKCGCKNSENAQFCVGCGNKFNIQAKEIVADNKPTDGKATASLVLGIISLVIPCLGIITAIIGLILGIVSKSKNGVKKAGIIINSIAIVLFIIIGIIILTVIPNIENIIEEEWQKIITEEEITSKDDWNDKWDNIETDDSKTTKNNDTKLSKKENGKTIVYLFRGEGCPHCQEAEEWFESIEKEYGNMFIIKDYEVWYNDDNAKFMQDVATSRGEEVNGVPYIIIGDKSWKGFTNSYENEMLEEIKKVYNE
jgi:thiol-disulfide isomerase/thioredoxin